MVPSTTTTEHRTEYKMCKDNVDDDRLDIVVDTKKSTLVLPQLSSQRMLNYHLWAEPSKLLLQFVLY